MRIVAISDSHGNESALTKVVNTIKTNGRVDYLFHCGDGVSDLSLASSVLRNNNDSLYSFGVKGNCDFYTNHYPAILTMNISNIKVIVTHGHNFNVKNNLDNLIAFARSECAKIVFFGHTHQPVIEEIDGIYMINPGAIINATSNYASYAEVLLDNNGKICPNLVKWKE